MAEGREPARNISTRLLTAQQNSSDDEDPPADDMLTDDSSTDESSATDTDEKSETDTQSSDGTQRSILRRQRLDRQDSAITVFENSHPSTNSIHAEHELPLKVCIGSEELECWTSASSSITLTDSLSSWPPNFEHVLDNDNVANKVLYHLPISGNIYSCRSALIRWLEGRKGRGQRYVKRTQLCEQLQDRNLSSSEASLLCSLIDAEGLGRVDVELALDALYSARFRLMPAFFGCDLAFRASAMRVNSLVPGQVDLFCDHWLNEQHREMLRALVRCMSIDGQLLPSPFHQCWHSVHEARLAVFRRLINLRDVPPKQVTKLNQALDLQITASSGHSTLGCLTDGRHNTFWESEGATGMHWIRFRLRKGYIPAAVKMDVDCVDTSYMPNQVQVLAGRNSEALREICSVEIPPRKVGYHTIDLSPYTQKLYNNGKHLSIVQLNIKRCINDGCDTRVRGLIIDKCKHPNDRNVGAKVIEQTAQWQGAVMMAMLDVCMHSYPAILEMFLSQTEQTLSALAPLSWCPYERKRTKKTGFVSTAMLEKMGEQLEKLLDDPQLALPNRIRVIKCIIRLAMVFGSVTPFLSLLMRLHEWRLDDEQIDFVELLRIDLLDYFNFMAQTTHKVKMRVWRHGEPADLQAASIESKQTLEIGQTHLTVELKPKPGRFGHLAVNSIRMVFPEGYDASNVAVHSAGKELDLRSDISGNELKVSLSGLNVVESLELEIERRGVPLDTAASVEIKVEGLLCRFSSCLSPQTQSLLNDPKSFDDDINLTLLTFVLDLLKCQFQLAALRPTSIVDMTGFGMEMLLKTFTHVFSRPHSELCCATVLELVNVSVRGQAFKIDSKTAVEAASELFGHLAMLMQSETMSVPASAVLKNGASFFIRSSEERRQKFFSLLFAEDRTELDGAVLESLSHYFSEQRQDGEKLFPLPFDTTESDAKIDVDAIILALRKISDMVGAELLLDSGKRSPTLLLMKSLIYDVFSFYDSMMKQHETDRKSGSICEKLFYGVCGVLFSHIELVLRNSKCWSDLTSHFAPLLYLALIAVEHDNDIEEETAAAQFLEDSQPILELILEFWPQFASSLHKDPHLLKDELKPLKSWTVSSSHPCKADFHVDDADRSFHQVGAVAFELSFVSKCCLSKDRGDRLIFLTSDGAHKMLSDKDLNVISRGDNLELTLISTDALYFSFRSTDRGDYDDYSQPDDSWGYEFTVTAKGPKRFCNHDDEEICLLIIKLIARISSLAIAQLSIFVDATPILKSPIWKAVFNKGKFAATGPLLELLESARISPETGQGDHAPSRLDQLIDCCRLADARPVVGGAELVKLMRATFTALIYHDPQLRDSILAADSKATDELFLRKLISAYSSAVNLAYQLLAKRQQTQDSAVASELVGHAIDRVLYLVEFWPADDIERQTILEYAADSSLEAENVEEKILELELRQSCTAIAYGVVHQILQSSESSLKLFFLKELLDDQKHPPNLNDIGSWTYVCESSVALDRNFNAVGKRLIECVESASSAKDFPSEVQFLVHLCHYLSTRTSNCIRFTRAMTKGTQTRLSDAEMMFVLERLLDAALGELAHNSHRPLTEDEQPLTEDQYEQFMKFKKSGHYSDTAPAYKHYVAAYKKNSSSCDSCEVRLGKVRYRCLRCLDIDLCTSCFECGNRTYNTGHTPDHPLVFMTYTCDECQGTIMGSRYHCNQCVDFDLCRGCYHGYGSPDPSKALSEHENDHVFEEIPAMAYFQTDASVLSLLVYLKPLALFTLGHWLGRLLSLENRRLNEVGFHLLSDRLTRQIGDLGQDSLKIETDTICPLTAFVSAWIRLTNVQSNKVAKTCVQNCLSLVWNDNRKLQSAGFGLLSQLLLQYGPELTDEAINEKQTNAVEGLVAGTVTLVQLYAFTEQSFVCDGFRWPSMFSSLLNSLLDDRRWIEPIRALLLNRLAGRQSREYVTLLLTQLPCVWFPGMPCKVQLGDDRVAFAEYLSDKGQCRVVDAKSRTIRLVSQDKIRAITKPLAWHPILKADQSLVDKLPHSFRLQQLCDSKQAVDEVTLQRIIYDSAQTTGFNIDISAAALETAELLLNAVGRKRFCDLQSQCTSPLFVSDLQNKSSPSEVAQSAEDEFGVSAVIAMALPIQTLGQAHGSEIMRNLLKLHFVADSAVPEPSVIVESVRRFQDMKRQWRRFLRSQKFMVDRAPQMLEGDENNKSFDVSAERTMASLTPEPSGDFITPRPVDAHLNSLINWVTTAEHKRTESINLQAVHLILDSILRQRPKIKFGSLQRKIRRGLDILYSRRLLVHLLKTGLLPLETLGHSQLFQIFQLASTSIRESCPEVIQPVVDRLCVSDNINTFLPDIISASLNSINRSVPNERLLTVPLGPIRHVKDMSEAYIYIGFEQFHSWVDMLLVERVTGDIWYHEESEIQVHNGAQWQTINAKKLVYSNNVRLRLRLGSALRIEAHHLHQQMHVRVIAMAVGQFKLGYDLLHCLLKADCPLSNELFDRLWTALIFLCCQITVPSHRSKMIGLLILLLGRANSLDQLQLDLLAPLWESMHNQADTDHTALTSELNQALLQLFYKVENLALASNMTSEYTRALLTLTDDRVASLLAEAVARVGYVAAAIDESNWASEACEALRQTTVMEGHPDDSGSCSLYEVAPEPDDCSEIDSESSDSDYSQAHSLMLFL